MFGGVVVSPRVGQHLVVASMCVLVLIQDAYDDWRWCYVDAVVLCMIDGGWLFCWCGDSWLRFLDDVC